MSVEAITWALAQAIPHSSAKFVLVAIANLANADGQAWPSVGYLAEATSQDRKTVQANIARLRGWGYLHDSGLRKGATKQVIVYELKTPEIGPVKEAQKRNSTRSGTVPNFPPKEPVFPEKEAQISSETGPKTGHGTIKEPLKEPSRKPTRKSARKSAEVPLPTDFAISDRVRRWAQEKGHGHLEARHEHFVSKAKARGYQYIDWDEAFMNAIREDWAKLNGRPGSPAQSGKHSGFQERTYVGTDPQSIDWAN